MEFVKDFTWKPGLTASELVDQLANTGYQSVELARAARVIAKMKRNGAKIYLTFTSNMVTSGLRGFFAQLIKLGIPDVIVTTIGGLEEDMMKAHGQDFILGSFASDDVELHEQGVNRVGNIHIENESYMALEDYCQPLFERLYEEQARWTPSQLLRAIGEDLDDENSILVQAAKHDIPVFCPAITDGSFGFQLYMFQQNHKDFVVDVVGDFGTILFSSSHDDKKAVIALGGSVSKHHAILATLLNGGADYAVYMTTAHKTSGSMSGATTSEAKSWGKVRDDSDAATVHGDVTINFPLAMSSALSILDEEGLL